MKTNIKIVKIIVISLIIIINLLMFYYSLTTLNEVRMSVYMTVSKYELVVLYLGLITLAILSYIFCIEIVEKLK